LHRRALSTSPTNRHHKHRHTNELRAEILSVLPNRITKVMFLSNLPYAELKKHLQDLERMELLHYDNADAHYYITARGSKFLSIYERMRRELGD
jgi:predicted transcriptional regulator